MSNSGFKRTEIVSNNPGLVSDATAEVSNTPVELLKNFENSDLPFEPPLRIPKLVYPISETHLKPDCSLLPKSDKKKQKVHLK